MSHTPGPWIAEHVGRGLHNGWWVHGPGKRGEYDRIVEMASAQDWDYGPIDSEADARLIASAPDLLSALERLCSVAFPPPFIEVRRLQEEARATIAKAKGEV
jgi:hypothetical protein